MFGSELSRGGFMQLLRPKRDKVAEAKAIATGFWGTTHGGPDEQADVFKALRALKLKPFEITEVRDGLSVGASGTAGDRIRSLDSFLERLEH